MPSRSIAESLANGDAGGASRPELVHSDHNSYLSTPLDLRGTRSSKPDNVDNGKELALEMDGEWFGDAQEAASLAAQKVLLVSRRVLCPLMLPPLQKRDRSL